MEKDIIRICWKVSEIFELSAREDYLPVNFTKKWLGSNIAKRMYIKDEKVLKTNNDSIINCLRKEFGEKLYKSKNGNPSHYAAIMDWTGYIFSYIILNEGYKAKDLLENYDIERIMENYDVLHTLSSKRAIEEIESEYNFGKNVYENIFEIDER